MAVKGSFVKTNWLNAATAATTTAAEDVTGAGQYGLQVSFTGSPTGGIVYLEGSIDGTNWVQLIPFNVATDPSGRIAWSLTGVPGGLATNRPVVSLRLNFSGFEGGTSPTLTASAIAI